MYFYSTVAKLEPNVILLKYPLFLVYISQIHFNLSLNLQVKRNNVTSFEMKSIKSTILWAL